MGLLRKGRREAIFVVEEWLLPRRCRCRSAGLVLAQTASVAW
jgi:hypothetical protein